MTNAFAHITRRPVLLAALTLASASVLFAGTMVAAAPHAPAGTSGLQTSAYEEPAPVEIRQAVRSRAEASLYSYGWPVKPFNRQHPVRGFFGDPRISNHGESRQFHFGVDVSAPNGTPVYATTTGTVFIHPLHATTVAIVGPAGVEFSYWHVVPTVRSGERAIAYETMIGRIEAPYGHVHFSEARNGRYLNPLRPGAMGPFTDNTRPSVTSVRVDVDGRVALVVEAYDETPLAVPRPWHDLPVTPALVRWRLVDSEGRSVLGWKTVVDFRLTIPPASAYEEVWAQGTTQNHVRLPGRYQFYLSRGLPGLRAGAYVVEVAARDTRGNATSTRFPLVIRAPLSGS